MSCCNGPQKRNKQSGAKRESRFLDRVMVSDEIRNERYAMCKVCEHYTLGICSLCGCILSLKTKLAASQCPLEKWTML